MTTLISTPASIRSESEAIKDIFEMHRYCRPMGSKAEEKFRAEFIKPLGVEEDAKGNLIKYIGDSRVLWSSHTDTVHSVSGFQRITVGKGMTLSLHRSSHSNCLGADCTAGVFIMREMILAGVPGLYVFHHGEERGGIGSSFIKSKTPELLKDIDFAIAFDRYGTTSIITHQMSGRCCSDEFVQSMDAALGGGYKGDSGGSFTDTANYTDLVAECTNISVGYARQHTQHETQDIRYLLDLRLKMLRFDESKLVKKRKPGEIEKRVYRGIGGWADFDDSDWVGSHWSRSSQPRLPFGGNTRRSYSDFARLLRDNAAAVADWLESEGIDYEEVHDAVMLLQGFVKG